MSARGPSRHFVAAQQFSRFRCRADITRLAADHDPVANDPSPTWSPIRAIPVRCANLRQTVILNPGADVRRRDFMSFLGGTAVMWPLAARAQQRERMRRIGVLMSRAESDTEGQRYAAAFLQGLAVLGWAPGQNLKIEYRWQAGDASQAQAFARELVELRPDVLVANATPALAAMHQATRAIPIIFIGVADPVGQGFIPSLARPR